jgi:hypothetical protein
MLAAIHFRRNVKFKIPNSKFRVFENTMLRRMFGPETEEVAGGIPRSFMSCTLHEVLLR